MLINSEHNDQNRYGGIEHKAEIEKSAALLDTNSTRMTIKM